MQFNKELLQKIEIKAEEFCSQLGCRLYDLEYNGPSQLLRLYIDSEQEQAVSLEDCSNISKALSTFLDELDTGDNAYDLEVSSPGVERSLKKLWHFEKACNSKIEVKLQQSLGRFMEVDEKLEKTKKLMGLLKQANRDFIELEVENAKNVSILKLPMGQITKANMVFEF